MKWKVRLDEFGVEPKVCDLIAFNPAKYKGLDRRTCRGFSESGLPGVEIPKVPSKRHGQPNASGFYTPKTGFCDHAESKRIATWRVIVKFLDWYKKLQKIG